MKHSYDGYNWSVRLDKGELLAKSLKMLAKEQNIRGAWISGLGAASWAELGFYDLEAQRYLWKKFSAPLEITALTGNIAWEKDEPVLHVHVTLAGTDMLAVGGHLKELEVAGTCEIFLHRWFKEGLSRSQDEQTGLKLLDL